jgi:hypothetical protein
MFASRGVLGLPNIEELPPASALSTSPPYRVVVTEHAGTIFVESTHTPTIDYLFAYIKENIETAEIDGVGLRLFVLTG